MSVKNEANARDPNMDQTKKGNQWYFAMKARIGIDAESGGLVATVVRTTANEADVTQTEHLLHGEIRSKGLDKDTAQLHTLFALANLLIAKQWLSLPF